MQNIHNAVFIQFWSGQKGDYKMKKKPTIMYYPCVKQDEPGFALSPEKALFCADRPVLLQASIRPSCQFTVHLASAWPG